jgi:hypothetical protein
MCHHVGWLTDADQPGGQTRVAKVELRGLQEALGEIGEPGLDPEDQVAGLEDGEPRIGRHPRDPGIGGERRDVDKLADPPGTEDKEALEGGEIVDAQDLAHVPLHIRGHEVLEPVCSGNAAIMDTRKQSLLKQRLDSGDWLSRRTEFTEGEREQGEQAGPSREALRDGIQHLELAGTREKQSAGLRVGIDFSLEVGEQGRTPLDFVEDGLGTELAEESPRILSGEAAGVGILQREVGGIRCG